MYNKPHNIFIILLLLLVLVGCVQNEESKVHIVSNDSLSPYIIVQAKSHHIYNFENKLEKTTTFDLFLNVSDINNELTKKTITYELKAINVINESIFFKSNTPVTLPINQQLMFSTNIGGNGFKEFILNINDSKEHTFYEEVLHTTNEEIKQIGYPDEFISDVVSLDFEITEDDELYNVGFIINSNSDVHIDLQSFIATGDAKVYSFLGIYNYFRNSFPLTVKNNYIYKDMEIEYIYLRLFYYDLDGKKTEVRAKFLFEDLLDQI